jgi:hypothetical protein
MTSRIDELAGMTIEEQINNIAEWDRPKVMRHQHATPVVDAVLEQFETSKLFSLQINGSEGFTEHASTLGPGADELAGEAVLTIGFEPAERGRVTAFPPHGELILDSLWWLATCHHDEREIRFDHLEKGVVEEVVLMVPDEVETAVRRLYKNAIDDETRVVSEIEPGDG